MQRSSMIVSLVIAFFTFVSVTNGKVCNNPADYKGKFVCNFQGNSCSDSASFVQTCTGDQGTTSQWVPGLKVHGGRIPVGTAIATFLRSKYYGQAAIYSNQNATGIQVWDQMANLPVALRTIPWHASGFNNGENFFVILYRGNK